MQFLTFLFALTASAATITPNDFTKACPGGVDNVIVTEANTLNGTVNSEIGPARAPLLGNLPLSLVNNFAGGSLNAYISGLDSNGAVVFLAADGSLVYPTSGGSSVPVPIGADIAIPLPPRGQTLRITLPIALSSGRVYFAAGKLNFFMVFTGSGDGLVQPSINNLQDPSAGLNWGFVELTLTPKGVIWANISFVDFVGLVFGMRLVDRDGRVQEVLGLPAGAVDSICNELRAQGDVDGRPWAAHCIEGPTGRPLRVVSPNNYATINPGAFADYWTVYADEVWRRYANQPLYINTQNENGVVECRVTGDTLSCDGDNRGYAKPEAVDIWGCNSGPFGIRQGDNAVHYAVVPRLCAAFVRTTLLLAGGDLQPGVDARDYYMQDPTSHYSRVVHEQEVDGRGYAFPYDDVNPDGAEDAAGLVASGNFDVLNFFIGGV
ncbi:Glucan endo-1 like protein [Verticillium longisporum]|uniref:Glucan endo-1 like protein n=2 Tax=Verticillium TaxID=1036719 RepID=A0A8I2ZVG5_VERLO|nr:hypothetical protein VdG1_06122 [Verticillium dahliae VDG1]KAG7138719.1 Glucan endo-1 like protein [Verticillium longisporum]PNH42332.1 hypothetical protein VD0004_g4954 [Verticillium dahliae]PNH69909.1 hypothetical protein VD0001_g7029 [Verticillium dahliae]RBQ90581.1 hypothetical protein VDGD_10470 [Verticillium dahliae]